MAIKSSPGVVGSLLPRVNYPDAEKVTPHHHHAAAINTPHHKENDKNNNDDAIESRKNKNEHIIARHNLKESSTYVLTSQGS